MEEDQADNLDGQAEIQEDGKSERHPPHYAWRKVCATPPSSRPRCCRWSHARSQARDTRLLGAEWRRCSTAMSRFAATRDERHRACLARRSACVLRRTVGDCACVPRFVEIAVVVGGRPTSSATPSSRAGVSFRILLTPTPCGLGCSRDRSTTSAAEAPVEVRS